MNFSEFSYNFAFYDKNQNFFKILWRFWKYCFRKIRSCNFETVNSDTPKILKHEAWNIFTKTYSKFVTVHLHYKILKKIFQKRKQNEKIHTDSDKSTKLLKAKESNLPNYLLNNFSTPSWISFWQYYHAKSMFLTLLI